MIQVLFVCLGNICRSPLAQAIFNEKISESSLSKKFWADSAGTAAYHVGEAPDARSRANAKENGLNYTHSARQFGVQDFDEFQYIIAMDESNYHNIIRLAEQHEVQHSHIYLMRKFEGSPSSMEVPDPYYGGPRGFQEVFDILDRSTEGLIQQLKAEHL